MTYSTLPDVNFKASAAGQVSVDDAKGIVECFVAAIGNKDSVGDIIVPGAFDASLKRRKPRVVWGHNWNEPIGKVLEIVEVGPTDPRLPMKMRQAGVGGLFARVQFNLKSERGREAFSNVSFFGEEQEWSIGYKTLNGDFDPQKQANILKEVELYEVSPVLHGANQLTGTISIKSANKQPSPEKLDMIVAALTKKVGGNPVVLEIRDTHIDFSKDGKRWTIPWADLAAGHIVFAEPEETPSKDADAQYVGDGKDISSGTAGFPSRMGRVERDQTPPAPEFEGSAKHLDSEAFSRVDHGVEDHTEPDGKNNHGAIYLMPEDTKGLTVTGGLPGNYVGLPVKTLGPTENWTEDEQEKLKQILTKWVGTLPGAMTGNVTGVGNMGRNMVAYHVDVPGLSRARAALSDTVDLGTTPDTSDAADAFMPHMPVGYGVPHPEVPAQPVTFNRVRLAWSPDHHEDFPLPGVTLPKPGGCGCGCGCGAKDADDDVQLKVSVTDVPGAESNSNIGGEVLRGYGPHRGNLDKLIRYWRPIMKKKGGFRRCVAELMDHPELAPWKPLCAWLHHEITGLWPNEGHHHDRGREAVRDVSRALKGRKSAWSEEYGIHVKSDMVLDEDDDMFDDDDRDHAIGVLKKFCAAEPDFVAYVQHPDSWHKIDAKGNSSEMDDWHQWVADTACTDCDEKAVLDDGTDLEQVMELANEVADKVGRKISSANMAKLQQALTLLNEVVGIAGLEAKGEYVVLDTTPREMFALKSLLDPVAEFYGTEILVDEADGEQLVLQVKSAEQADAIGRALSFHEGGMFGVKALGESLGARARGAVSRMIPGRVPRNGDGDEYIDSDLDGQDDDPIPARFRPGSLETSPPRLSADPYEGIEERARMRDIVRGGPKRSTVLSNGREIVDSPAPKPVKMQFVPERPRSIVDGDEWDKDQFEWGRNNGLSALGLNSGELARVREAHLARQERNRQLGMRQHDKYFDDFEKQARSEVVDELEKEGISSRLPEYEEQMQKRLRKRLNAQVLEDIHGSPRRVVAAGTDFGGTSYKPGSLASLVDERRPGKSDMADGTKGIGRRIGHAASHVPGEIPRDGDGDGLVDLDGDGIDKEPAPVAAGVEALRRSVKPRGRREIEDEITKTEGWGWNPPGRRDDGIIGSMGTQPGDREKILDRLYDEWEQVTGKPHPNKGKTSIDRALGNLTPKQREELEENARKRGKLRFNEPDTSERLRGGGSSRMQMSDNGPSGSEIDVPDDIEPRHADIYRDLVRRGMDPDSDEFMDEFDRQSERIDRRMRDRDERAAARRAEETARAPRRSANDGEDGIAVDGGTPAERPQPPTRAPRRRRAAEPEGRSELGPQQSGNTPELGKGEVAMRKRRAELNARRSDPDLTPAERTEIGVELNRLNERLDDIERSKRSGGRRAPETGDSGTPPRDQLESMMQGLIDEENGKRRATNPGVRIVDGDGMVDEPGTPNERPEVPKGPKPINGDPSFREDPETGKKYSWNPASQSWEQLVTDRQGRQDRIPVRSPAAVGLPRSPRADQNSDTRVVGGRGEVGAVAERDEGRQGGGWN